MNNTLPKLTTYDLRQFTGDLMRFRHTFNPKVVYTPGVQYLAEAGRAYWLIDTIASYLSPSFVRQAAVADPRIAAMHFWTLKIRDDNGAVLEARADSPCEPFVRQEIVYTDFPLDTVNIWAANDGRKWTLYLPSEH